MAEEQQQALHKLGRLYDDASFASSARQIELVARDSEIAKLGEELEDLSKARDELKRLLDAARTEVAELSERLQAERKRSEDLDRRITGMLATVADREEKLDSRDKDLVALLNGSPSRSVARRRWRRSLRRCGSPGRPPTPN